MMGQQRRNRQRRHHAGGDGPVVAHDEVVPEAEEAPHEGDSVVRGASAVGTGRRFRFRTATRASETPSTKTRMAPMAASRPGQVTPAPSEPQKMPKVVSMV